MVNDIELCSLNVAHVFNASNTERNNTGTLMST